MTLVTRTDSTLENSRSNLHYLRGSEITLVFDYVVEASKEVDYVIVEASREANIIMGGRNPKSTQQEGSM